MSRTIDNYNGYTVWKVGKTAPERMPSAEQRRILPIERLQGESDEHQYVNFYSPINRDEFPANISAFIAIWEHFCGELQKLHNVRVVHGYLSPDAIVITDANTVTFTNFYGMPHVPFGEEAVQRDKMDLFATIRQLFKCDDPCRYPLKMLCDEFERRKCDAVWLRTCVNANVRLSSCTFTAKIDENSYECAYSSTRARCVVKFTNEAEIHAYTKLSSMQICPTLLFSRSDDACFGSYLCHGKIDTRCPINIDKNTAVRAFQMLDAIHGQKIAHLNIGPDSVICQSLKNNPGVKRLLFNDFSLSRGNAVTSNSELSTAVHSIELRREPHRLDLTKSDDVFALAVLLLCTITRVKPSQVEYAIACKKAARKAYADVRELFKREINAQPVCKILLEAVVPHDERPSARDIVTKLKRINHDA